MSGRARPDVGDEDAADDDSAFYRRLSKRVTSLNARGTSQTIPSAVCRGPRPGSASARTRHPAIPGSRMALRPLADRQTRTLVARHADRVRRSARFAASSTLSPRSSTRQTRHQRGHMTVRSRKGLHSDRPVISLDGSRTLSRTAGAPHGPRAARPARRTAGAAHSPRTLMLRQPPRAADPVSGDQGSYDRQGRLRGRGEAGPGLVVIR